MTAAIGAWAAWLQRQLGAWLFPVDHPALPRCAGWHKPEYPCDGQRGKHPACKWSRDASASPDAIRAALARGLRNTGIDCGKSGLLVVDEDIPGAFTGYAGGRGLVIPATFTVNTREGRRHFYFRQPAEPVGNGTGSLPAGVDIRGRGGYVVAPGSVHQTGAVYTAADPRVPVAAAPDWLVTVLRPPVPAPRFRQPGGSGPGHRGTVPARLRGLVAVVLDARPPGPGGKPPGKRNDCLYWAACRAADMIAAGELDQAIAVRVLTEAGEATGLGPGAVAATIDSALRKVLA